jgi:hypothetical protein
MAYYRLYCLDGAGHIGFADWFEAKDDDAAIAQARKLRADAQVCEVWQEKRLVARLNHAGQVELPSG